MLRPPILVLLLSLSAVACVRAREPETHLEVVVLDDVDVDGWKDLAIVDGSGTGPARSFVVSARTGEVLTRDSGADSFEGIERWSWNAQQSDDQRIQPEKVWQRSDAQVRSSDLDGDGEEEIVLIEDERNTWGEMSGFAAVSIFSGDDGPMLTRWIREPTGALLPRSW